MTELDPVPPDPSTEPTKSPPDKETLGRLEKLFNEADLVKVLSLRRLAKEVDVPEAEGVDNQKEKQMVLKSIEIQLRILAELRRRDADVEIEPSLDEIWEALLQVPETGALLRRDAVRARILAVLRERLREGK
jgi:hypothetical protein